QIAQTRVLLALISTYPWWSSPPPPTSASKADYTTERRQGCLALGARNERETVEHVSEGVFAQSVQPGRQRLMFGARLVVVELSETPCQQRQPCECRQASRWL